MHAHGNGTSAVDGLLILSFWAGKDLNPVTPAMTRSVSFFRWHPMDRLIQAPCVYIMYLLRTYSYPVPYWNKTKFWFNIFLKVVFNSCRYMTENLQIRRISLFIQSINLNHKANKWRKISRPENSIRWNPG